jgi:peptidoglycan/LPS O-acetylase OafA/YrhL
MGAIRLFLALSVVLWHVPNHVLGGVDAGVAVLFFFIISGFYMAMVIEERYGAAGETGWRWRFYASRLLRLFPAYFATAGLILLEMALAPRRHMALSEMGQPLWSSVLIVAMNLTILGQDIFQAFVNSLTNHEPNGFTAAAAAAMPDGFFYGGFMLIGQAWSLASELLFYALAPFVVRSPLRIAVLFVASLAIRWTLIFGLGFSSEIWSYNFFPGTLCLFLLGSIAYRLYARVRTKAAAPVVGLAIAAAIAAFSLWSIWRYGGVLLIDRATGYDTPRLWLAFVAFAASLPFLFAACKANPLDRWIGELSYPLYLVHGTVLSIIFYKLRLPGGDPLWDVAAVLLSLGAATLMFWFIDRRVDAWRHRRYSTSPRLRVHAPAMSEAR